MQLPSTHEHWNEALFDQNPIPMVLVSPDHRFCRLNDAFCALVGYSRTELLHRTWQSITHPDDVEWDQRGAEDLAHNPARQIYTVTKRYIHKTGHSVWTNLHVRSIWLDNHFTGYCVIAIPATIAHPTLLPPKPFSLLEWCRANPKDTAIIGMAGVLFFGRDSAIELIKLFLVK